MLLFAINGIAQQPAHFLFAEEQFKGIQIYDVIQDNDLNYWFATNEGLYCYDYKQYKKIECNKAKSNSFFNFTINKNGIIFCHNLNNQIFKIKNKECFLFYELKPNERSSDVSLTCTNDGNLIVAAKKIIILNENGNIIQEQVIKTILSLPFNTEKYGFHFHLMGMDSIIVFDKGHLKKHKLIFPSTNLKGNSMLRFFIAQKKCYALDVTTKELYNYNPKTIELKSLPKSSAFDKSNSIRIYESDIGLWVTGNFQGVAFINKNLTKENFPIYFKDYFISDIFKDHEGNFLLSTFNNGIIVIPNPKIPDVIYSFKDGPAITLYSDSSSGIFIGTSKGEVFNYYNNILTTINDKGNRSIEGIYGSPKSNLIFFDNEYITAYNKLTKTHNKISLVASLKDVAYVSNSKVYLGTNRGIYAAKIINDKTLVKSFEHIINYRIYSLEYNDYDGLLYASTANGFFIINANNDVIPILVNNEGVFPNDLYYDNSYIYATTKKNGILKLQNGKIHATIQPIINNKKEVFNKNIIYNNTIFAKTSQDLFQFDMKGNFLKSIRSAYSFSNKRIINFTFYKNQLWVSHSGGIQPIDLSNSKTIIQKPFIRLDQVLMNDQIVEQLGEPCFKSEKLKLQFNYSSPTISNKTSIRFYYKLIGYDHQWNINNFEINQTTYSMLSPGNYTFSVKAENQGVYSEPINYPFNIETPYYKQWWFICLVIIVFLVIVFCTYKWRLNIQKQKLHQINELNSSKLTAIQSQMNPHFIFNSLNSIQDLVLKGDIEKSYSYITTFSNLVRKTLSYSEKDFIDFEQEIKLLEIYLSLEKLRFKKDFIYKITHHNIEDIMIPPLLIQPFIENSLLHGLLHKDGEKKLTISFELKDTLICIVEDNGVGREKSKSIKLRQRSEHESFSVNAIYKRFEILSNVFNGHFGYVYEDVITNNEISGTRVILSMPIKHKF